MAPSGDHGDNAIPTQSYANLLARGGTVWLPVAGIHGPFFPINPQLVLIREFVPICPIRRIKHLVCSLSVALMASQ